MVRLGVMGKDIRKYLVIIMGRKLEEFGRVGWVLNIKLVFGRVFYKYVYIRLFG